MKTNNESDNRARGRGGWQPYVFLLVIASILITWWASDGFAYWDWRYFTGNAIGYVLSVVLLLFLLFVGWMIVSAIVGFGVKGEPTTSKRTWQMVVWIVWAFAVVFITFIEEWPFVMFE